MTGKRRKPADAERPAETTTQPARPGTRRAPGSLSDIEPTVAPPPLPPRLPPPPPARGMDVLPTSTAPPAESLDHTIATGGRPGVLPGKPKRRRPLLVAGSALLVVLICAGGWWFFLRDTTEETLPPPGRQRTLLVHVVDPEGRANSSALLGVDDAGRQGAVVLVPSRLRVPVEGVGEGSFGETLLLADPGAPADIMSGLVGVTIDGQWWLTTAGLGALVDRAGGVQAEVDVDVVTKNAKGAPTVVVQSGPQRLEGSAAAAYATYLAEGEPELARLARFEEVLRGVLAGLPAQRAALTAALAALGEGARTTLAPGELEAVLGRLRRAAVRGEVLSDVLPTTEIASEGQPSVYEYDSARAADLFQLRFADVLTRQKP